MEQTMRVFEKDPVFYYELYNEKGDLLMDSHYLPWLEGYRDENYPNLKNYKIVKTKYFNSIGWKKDSSI